jgi:hypothetical protein
VSSSKKLLFVSLMSVKKSYNIEGDNSTVEGDGTHMQHLHVYQASTSHVFQLMFGGATVSAATGEVGLVCGGICGGRGRVVCKSKEGARVVRKSKGVGATLVHVVK